VPSQELLGLLAPKLLRILDRFSVKLYVLVEIGDQSAFRKRLGRLENSILDEMRFDVIADERIECLLAYLRLIGNLLCIFDRPAAGQAPAH
jgi:hypothetical protein